MDDLPHPVGHGQLHRHAARIAVVLGGDHGRPAHPLLHRGDQLLGLGAHRVGQAALHRVGVPGALFRDAVALLTLGDVARLHQLRQTVGIVEVAHAAVALAKLRQGLRVHRPRQPPQNIEDQDFDIQLFMYESQTFHGHLHN